jgi:hypothetical protein
MRLLDIDGGRAWRDAHLADPVAARKRRIPGRLRMNAVSF